MTDDGSLRIDGDSGDVFVAEGFDSTGETETIEGATYQEYTSGSAQVWIEESLVSSGTLA